MSARSVVSSIVLASLLSASAATAQQPSGETGIAAELRTLNQHAEETVQALLRLVRAREEEHKLRKLEVAILALQVRLSGLAEIEARTRQLRDRRAESSEELAEREAELARIEVLQRSEQITATDRENLNLVRDELTSRVELLKQRLAALDQSIVEAENDMMGRRREIDALEDKVADSLDAL